MRFGDDHRDPPQPSGPPKSRLQQMLADAVRNTAALSEPAKATHEPAKATAAPAKTAVAPQPQKAAIPVAMPTADEVARAIVAAARETGESAIGCIKGGSGPSRCRHYAMHALAKVFPDLPKSSCARLVGCPGKPTYAWKNSVMHVAAPVMGTSRRRAKWWDEAAFERVVRAITK